MSVTVVEWFDNEVDHIEIAPDQRTFHYSLLLPNDNNQGERYSGVIELNLEEKYGLIMRQFLETVSLNSSFDGFEAYVSQRILGGHDNNRSAIELFNEARKEDFIIMPNLSDKEQLHGIFVRFGKEKAEALYDGFIKVSNGKQYVDSDLKHWLKENLPELFTLTDNMAWVARMELFHTIYVASTYKDDPSGMDIISRDNYQFTPEHYCYYIAIRRLFDSQYQLWKLQSSKGNIQYQHFIRRNYEPAFGRGVVFYSYNLLTKQLYSFLFDYLVDSHIEVSSRLAVFETLKRIGNNNAGFLQFLDEGFEPYRKSSGTSMRFVQEERRPKDNPEQGMPTDEDFLKYPSTGDNTAFYRASKFGSSSALRMSIIYKLFVFLVSQGKLENTQNNLMQFAFRLTGKSPYAIETDKKLCWLGPKSDYSLCYFAWYVFTKTLSGRSKAFDGRYWTKTGQFFEYADGNVFDGIDEQSRRQDFSKGRDITDPFANALREKIDELMEEQKSLTE